MDWRQTADAGRVGANARQVDEWRFRTLVALRERKPGLLKAVLTGTISLHEAERRMNGDTDE